MSRIHVSAMAQKYAALPYQVIVRMDNCGELSCFTAENPELGGCLAQGFTKEEALISLVRLREEFIQVLLDEDIDLPLPSPRVSFSSGSAQHNSITVYVHDIPVAYGEAEADQFSYDSPKVAVCV